MISLPGLPRLNAANHRETSPATAAYNCLAWAAGETNRWWEPGYYWPLTDDRFDFSPDALVAALRAVGFEPSDDGEVEAGYQKIALYQRGGECTHAARQLPTGNWTSKLGKFVDIEHDTPEDVGGGVYGEAFAFLKRPVNPSS